MQLVSKHCVAICGTLPASTTVQDPAQANILRQIAHMGEQSACMCAAAFISAGLAGKKNILAIGTCTPLSLVSDSRLAQSLLHLQHGNGMSQILINTTGDHSLLVASCQHTFVCLFAFNTAGILGNPETVIQAQCQLRCAA